MTRRGETPAAAVRLALFAALLVVLAGVAALVGRASGVGVGPHDDAKAHGTEAGGGAPANGLSDTAAGLRLRLGPPALRPGVPGELGIQLRNADGEAVTELDEAHGGPPLHLILVRRDLADYLHLHPKRDDTSADFVADVTLPSAGVWRAYADFELDGEKIVLGRDLLAPGEFVPRELPLRASSATTGGYSVELDHDALRAGSEQTLAFRITRGGRRIDPQPYLGAAGHLVAIREDDLAYLHVHPVAGTAFDAEFAAAGRYALFLQFKHDGRVRTVRFTISVAR